MSKAQHLKDQLNDLIHQARIDQAIVVMNSNHTIQAITGIVQQPNWIRGFILISDDLLTLSKPGDEKHIEAMLVLAHELTHFRNRVLSQDLLSEPITADDYVNPVLAESSFLDHGVNTESVRTKFIEEICCRHVSWRVHQDLIEDHARQRINAGVIVRPHALEDLKSNLTVGSLISCGTKIGRNFAYLF
ncbi:hypothetical protein QUF86_22965 [Peribacillus sp. NJ11]|uniref:hypothetical protein n=1 Tax=Peribacillus sp. NJ11 TaxID=3055861 RepID=UPI0025A29612|nr:hypothetical protein [Peribacillus sp. NJ11]MDM5223537.1 hypothetical protein [Peribacillus sp. NJ11]